MQSYMRFLTTGQQASLDNLHSWQCQSHHPYLEGSFDVIIHHLDVGLIDAHGAPRQPTSLVDRHMLQLGVPLPVLLQDQQDFLLIRPGRRQGGAGA